MPGEWPDAAAFREAFQNPRTCFVDDELRDSAVITDRRGFPLTYSGNFASVFKVRTDAKSLAVRCFLRDVGDRERRYKAIEVHLASGKTGSITHFEYVKEGVRIRGRPYPILIMDWVDGLTLDQYVRSNAASADTFRALSQRWLQIVGELERAVIGHGDLQHGNILVAAGDLKLVDYDGMYVPALRGLTSTETGHRAYQHPGRTEKYFGPEIDRFSALVVYLSLAAFAQKPSLAAHCTGDRLLLDAADFRNPQTSAAFAELSRMNGSVKELTNAVRQACAAPIERVPRLLDLVPTGPVSGLPGWMRSDTAIPTPTQIHVDPPRTGPTRTSTPRPEAVSTSPSGFGAGAATLKVVVPLPAPMPTGKRTFDTAGFASGCFIWALISNILVAGLLQLPSEPAVILFIAGAAVIAARNYRIRLPAKQPPVFSPPRQPRPTWTPPVTTHVGIVVASAIRTVYHRPSCEWARKMSSRNRIQFSSAADARAKRYRPCRVCRP